MKKIELWSILFNECVKNLNIEVSDDKILLYENEEMDVYDYVSIEIKPIAFDNDVIDSVLFFGDGTVEFHLASECDAINWGEFDVEVIEKVIQHINKLNCLSYRTEIVNQLESLVHKRFSYEKLNEILCSMFGVTDIYCSDCDSEAEELNGDYDMEFAITKPMIGGVFDIYYLPMKRKGLNGEEIYITEVGYMFDM